MRVAETYVSGNRVRLRVLPETPLSAAATIVDRNIMPPPSQEPTFTPPLPVRDRLPNGMGVTVVEQSGMPIVAFGVLLGSGASADPGNLPGLAGLVGGMLPEGAGGKSSQQIANDFEFIGARLSVDSRREYSMVFHRDPHQALGQCARDDGGGIALARLSPARTGPCPA